MSYFRSAPMIQRSLCRRLCAKSNTESLRSSEVTIVLREGRLLMLSASIHTPLSKLVPGQIFHTASGYEACTIFQRAGFHFAALLGSTTGHPRSGGIDAGELATPLHSSLEVGVSMPDGRCHDGEPVCLDYRGREFTSKEDEHHCILSVPLFRVQPQQLERQVIGDWLPSGITAVDALTPIGRGQSMLLFGGKPEPGLERHEDAELDNSDAFELVRAAALDAIASQKTTDVHCVYAKLDSTKSVTAQSFDGKTYGFGMTVVDASAISEQPHPSAPAEDNTCLEPDACVQGFMAAAAACAVGEAIRDGNDGTGRDVLVTLDDLSPLRRLWERAGHLLESHMGRRLTPESELTEMRHYYSPLLQRAACMNPANGGGTLSMLVTVPNPPSPASSSCGDGDTEISQRVLAALPASVRGRLEHVRARGIPLTSANLHKIGLDLDGTLARCTDHGTSESSSTEPEGTGIVKPAEWQVARRHNEEIKSIADGHILLDASREPSLDPTASLTRIGMARRKEIRDVRPRALQSVAQGLRYHLVALEDRVATAGVGTAKSGMVASQDHQLRAWRAALSQPPGQLTTLDVQVVLLYAVSSGLFANAGGHSFLVGGSEAPLVQHLRATAPELLAQIRSGADLSHDELERKLNISLRLFKAIQA